MINSTLTRVFEQYDRKCRFGGNSIEYAQCKEERRRTSQDPQASTFVLLILVPTTLGLALNVWRIKSQRAFDHQSPSIRRQ